MLKIIKAGVIISIIGGLFVSCENDEAAPEIEHPLTGQYTLTEMTINVEATTLRDTTLAFITPQNGEDSITISAGTLILVESDLYTDADPDPIGGTVTLRNDMSGTLSGNLPVNWGTGCAPSVLISGLTSDGTWSADTTTGIFTLDLVVDALDIEGNFSMVGDQLEIRYFTQTPADQRMINTLPINGSDVPVEQTCIAVSTITERVMLLDIEN
jgi:hypothetical protein